MVAGISCKDVRSSRRVYSVLELIIKRFIVEVARSCAGRLRFSRARPQLLAFACACAVLDSTSGRALAAPYTVIANKYSVAFHVSFSILFVVIDFCRTRLGVDVFLFIRRAIVSPITSAACIASLL